MTAQAYPIAYDVTADEELALLTFTEGLAPGTLREALYALLDSIKGDMGATLLMSDPEPEVVCCCDGHEDD